MTPNTEGYILATLKSKNITINKHCYNVLALKTLPQRKCLSKNRDEQNKKQKSNI